LKCILHQYSKNPGDMKEKGQRAFGPFSALS
jgi:hypothetical protein